MSSTEAIAAPESPPRKPIRALRGAGVLLGGQAGGQLLGFVRNMIVARLISPADFGIASTFAVTMAFLNMLGDLSIDKLLVQASDGDEPRVQATAQMVQFLRGLVSSVILFIGAELVASIFAAPDAAWAYRLLALVPLLRGLAHLDVRRFQRTLRFGPGTIVDGVPQIVATLVTWPLAVWLGDFRVVVYSVLLQEVTCVVMSHAMAERRYEWSRDREATRRILSFGWPLMVNAVLMFGIFQGDRVVVGTSYGLDQLGAYSLGFMLTMVPTALLAGAATSLVLPVLARVQDDARQFEDRTAVCAQAIALVAAVVMIPMVLAGGPLAVALFGSKYAVAVPVVPWLAATQAVRIFRLAPTVAAIARADTVNSMMSNVWRSSGIGAMAIAGLCELDLPWIAAAGLGGEIAALLYSLGRLRRKQGIAWMTTGGPSGVAFLGTSVALASAVCFTLADRPVVAVATAAVLQIATVGALLAVFPTLRILVRDTLATGLRTIRDLAMSPR